MPHTRRLHASAGISTSGISRYRVRRSNYKGANLLGDGARRRIDLRCVSSIVLAVLVALSRRAKQLQHFHHPAVFFEPGNVIDRPNAHYSRARLRPDPAPRVASNHGDAAAWATLATKNDLKRGTRGCTLIAVNALAAIPVRNETTHDSSPFRKNDTGRWDRLFRFCFYNETLMESLLVVISLNATTTLFHCEHFGH